MLLDLIKLLQTSINDMEIAFFQQCAIFRKYVLIINLGM